MEPVGALDEPELVLTSRRAMIAALTNAFVPIFAGLLRGYLAGLRKFVDNQNVRTLITFVMSVAVPCSLFSSVDHLSRPVLQQQGQVAAVLGAAYMPHFDFTCSPKFTVRFSLEISPMNSMDWVISRTSASVSTGERKSFKASANPRWAKARATARPIP